MDSHNNGHWLISFPFLSLYVPVWDSTSIKTPVAICGFLRRKRRDWPLDIYVCNSSACFINALDLGCWIHFAQLGSIQHRRQPHQAPSLTQPTRFMTLRTHAKNDTNKPGTWHPWTKLSRITPAPSADKAGTLNQGLAIVLYMQYWEMLSASWYGGFYCLWLRSCELVSSIPS